MEQYRDIDDAARLDLLQNHRRQRVIFLQLPLLDPGEQPDSADRMFVDGIVMVHVKLHLRDDTAEIGNKAAEHPRLVHPAQHRFRIARGRQHIKEQRVGTRDPSHRACVDQFRVVARLAHRLRMNFEPIFVSERENLDQTYRVVAKETVGRQREAPAIEDKAVELSRPATDRRQEAPPPRRELVVEMREEGAGNVANAFGMDEIELHEALDRAFPRPLGEMHPARDFGLEIESQPILGAAREDMEVAAHREKEVFGALELAKLACR